MQNEEYYIFLFMSLSFAQNQETYYKMIVDCVICRNTVERGLLKLNKFYYFPSGTFSGAEIDHATVDCITLIPIFLLDIDSEDRYISRA